MDTRLAREKGSIKKDWGGKIPVALVYPSHYRVGMSNLGFQRVYWLFNRRPDTVAERFFLPEDPGAFCPMEGAGGLGNETSLRQETGFQPVGLPARRAGLKSRAILSIESKKSLRDFSLVAFSLSFENDYPNILKLLDLGGIPLLSEERKENFPLVCAGGVTTFLNPEPIADLMDFFLLGEAEELIDPFMDLFKELARERLAREVLLGEIAKCLEFVYVPRFYNISYGKDGKIESFEPARPQVPTKIKVKRGDLGKGGISAIVSPEVSFPDTVLVEVGRGCGRGCRFCAAGFVYRPPRSIEASSLLDMINGALSKAKKVGLISPALSDYPELEGIISRILDRGGTFSLSSLRADRITRSLLEQLKAAGQKSIAIAPEAGSERLRLLINKHLTENQIMEAASKIAEVWSFSIRLYFLVGLPTEAMEDVEEIVGLVKKFRHHMVKVARPRGTIGSIKLSINCFVPKAFTPFQWHPMEEVTSLKSKQKWLKKALGKMGGVTVSFDVPKWAYIQALLSMGDRRVGSILLRAHRLGGNWKRALTSSDVNPDFFVYREKDLEETLPWDFLDQGISKSYLAKEYMKALELKATPVCKVGKCTKCGVCE